MSKLLPTCYRRGASFPPAPPATPVGRGNRASICRLDSMARERNKNVMKIFEPYLLIYRMHVERGEQIIYE